MDPPLCVSMLSYLFKILTFSRRIYFYAIDFSFLKHLKKSTIFSTQILFYAINPSILKHLGKVSLWLKKGKVCSKETQLLTCKRKSH